MVNLEWVTSGGHPVVVPPTSAEMRELEPPLLFPDIGAKQKVLQRQRRKPSEHLFGCTVFFFGKKSVRRERENGEMLASRNKNGDHRYTKMSETWVFFPKLMMFPSNGSFHSAFAPQVKKYIPSCCWEVQAHQDQLRFQKRTSPR